MRLRGVGRRYGLRGPWVLRGVDLELPPGSLTRVEGTNGSGKSTLLRLLAGIDAPSTGSITGRLRTAYVPERFPAELPFSARGYLTHLGRIHGLGRAAAERGAGEWLERFGAAEHADTPLAELSKGTSQKVAVAQALLGAPGLLVLDEAWTGLDQAARTVLDAAVAERVADGGAVVFVDHDTRRLSGAADAVFRVADARLTPCDAELRPAAPASAAPSAPSAQSERRPGAAENRPPVAGPREHVPHAPRTAPTGDAGPRVAVVAEGPADADLPPDLPGAPHREPGPPGCADGQMTRRTASPGSPGEVPGREPTKPVDIASVGAAPHGDGHPRAGEAAGRAPLAGGSARRTVRLSVGAAHSDALLRALLTARPPWHIRSVAEVPHTRSGAPTTRPEVS
ncbi:ABC transporter ATP-binding protein [Streptomyces sp. 205]|uniref:ABC transporter ATP-binding protein n=1 Tax=Streptomyces coffeae TaxID=621382 RepID=A0ABS1NJB1_9ACTN|nr:ABC transporter ATP-binding protein [Streptomyces coffeae]